MFDGWATIKLDHDDGRTLTLVRPTNQRLLSLTFAVAGLGILEGAGWLGYALGFPGGLIAIAVAGIGLVFVIVGLWFALLRVSYIADGVTRELRLRRRVAMGVLNWERETAYRADELEFIAEGQALAIPDPSSSGEKPRYEVWVRPANANARAIQLGESGDRDYVRDLGERIADRLGISWKPDTPAHDPEELQKLLDPSSGNNTPTPRSG
ncbi:MAG: hypothetical protein WD009_04095 [Phycisphaeraceae bacterium]